MTIFERPGMGADAPDQLELDAVLHAAAMTVGADRVTGRLAAGAEPAPRPNVGMYRGRRVYARIRPRTPDQVARVVEVFAQHRAPCGVHAVSTGHNWGLGSHEPALDNAVTLELDDLDRVRALDTRAGWAVVEPGVTQGSLAGLLAGTERMLNATAASAHTSVIGNALDRGVGLRRQRVDDIAGLEVVLPDGEMVRVGWWPDGEGRDTAVYPHGVGPCPLPMFFQSNLGVVTAAVVRLLPRPEAQCVVRLSFGRPVLPAAIDVLRRWTAQGFVHGVLKVYDDVSTEFYGGLVGEFLAHVCVSGTAEYVDAVVDVLVSEAVRAGIFSAVVRSDEESASDVVATMAESAYAGDPSGNDAMLMATLGQSADHVDERGPGWLFFLPLVPFSGGAVARAHALLTTIQERTGIRAGSTVNALGPDLIDFVVSIKFDRAREVDPAHRALDLAHELFTAAGFLPYRLDIDHADWVDRLGTDPNARRFTRRLKNLIDPHGSIAPGRYA